MTEATREALLRIDQILHEAGWDQASSAPAASPGLVDVERLRRVHEMLVRQDHFDIPRALLGESITVEQLAEKIATEEVGRRLREALGRIRAFVDACEGVESELNSEKTADTTAEPR
ncbi:MAG TPA: hypothetical protein VMF69_20470 [Gemmataceae bacterium]|nr:hypothetical protein [Gemmataceae bacterium]